MPVDELTRMDSAARRAAIDTKRSFIVQAPAGSGKTELLIQRYLRLLGTVDDPEEVVAITFTRKAAAEMQLRVLQALQRAGRGERPSSEHERVTVDAAAIVLERDAESGWHLIRNPRRMRIQTLDSLNGSIARSRPVTSSAGAVGYAIVTDAAMKVLYRDAAAATLDQLAESGNLSVATVEVLTHVDTNAWRYVQYLEHMLATRDQWLPFVGSGALGATEAAELRLQFEAGLRRTVGDALQRVQQSLPTPHGDELLQHARYAAANLLADGRDDSPIASLAEISALPNPAPEDLGSWQGMAELLLNRQGPVRKRANKNLGFPTGDDGEKAAFHELLETIARYEEFADHLHATRELPPVTYSDEQWSVLLALFRLLPHAVAELKRLFAERGRIDHIEVALSAKDALGTAEDPGDIALLLDYQIRHILVDEMQDTSTAQYRMIEALTGGWSDGDGRTLFCVGDPMQSIYRFRNAEVGQFLLARDIGIGDVQLEALTLRRNFRSGEVLVDWFNDIFPDVLPAHDDPNLSAVAYSSAVPVPAQAGKGTVVVHPLVGADAAREADVAFAIINKTLAAHPDDDMAVLVRSRTHLGELLYKLRDAGVAYRAVEIDRLTDLPEVIDVLALTRAFVHLGDRAAWLALLRSPWVGLDWTDLHLIVRNDTRSAVLDRIRSEKVIAALSAHGQQAVRQFLRIITPELRRYRTDSLRNRVERAWLGLGGPAIAGGEHGIENVYRYFDVLARIEQGGDLVDVADLETTLDSEYVSSPADAKLQIMTMHRAKGLQFDHVLLHGLGRKPPSRDRAVLSWFDVPGGHGNPQLVISPVGPLGEISKDAIHNYIERVETRKDNHETGRLLYVACTRARKQLHLLGSASQRKDGLRPEKSSLLRLLWQKLSPDYETVSATDDDSASHDAEGDWLRPELRRLDPPWQSPAAPPLPWQPALKPDNSLPVDFYWVGAGARLAGTVTHRWLQRAVQGRFDPGSIDNAALAGTSRRWLQEMGISGADAEPIIERVIAALRGIAGDARGRWLLEGDGHAELSLTGQEDRSVVSVVLDRVRIDDDGTHWIVDYKTSTHEGGDLQGFLEAEVERYRAQLARYARIYGEWCGTRARCALYFPLLQRFVEVDV